jgi:hypothetical protein
MKIKQIIIFLSTLFLSILVYVGIAETTKIEAPYNLSVSEMRDDWGNEFILLTFDVPESVKLLGEKAIKTGFELYYEVDIRIGKENWLGMGGVRFSEGEQIAINYSDSGMDIKKNLYSFRVRVGYYFLNKDDSVSAAHSLYSNISYIGDKSVLGSYQSASSWAVQELDKALEYGLVTDKIRNKMNSPITREELCEVIMALYEALAGELPVEGTGIFTDTKNDEVNKASELGIVTGVGNNRFDPNAFTNREQVATMISRTVKALQPDVDFSIGVAESFIDEKEVSSWALESVRFMSKSGLLKGSNGKMDPKGVTTREQAVLIAVRAYEMFTLQDVIGGTGQGDTNDNGSDEKNTSADNGTGTGTGTDTGTGTGTDTNTNSLESIIIGKWSTHDNIGDMVDSNTGRFLSSEYYLMGLSLNEDGTFLRILITGMGMSKFTGNYKLTDRETGFKDGRIILFYNQKSEFYEPNATTPKESHQIEDDEYEIRYDVEDDTIIIDFIGFTTLKRLK